MKSFHWRSLQSLSLRIVFCIGVLAVSTVPSAASGPKGGTADLLPCDLGLNTIWFRSTEEALGHCDLGAKGGTKDILAERTVACCGGGCVQCAFESSNSLSCEYETECAPRNRGNECTSPSSRYEVQEIGVQECQNPDSAKGGTQDLRNLTKRLCRITLHAPITLYRLTDDRQCAQCADGREPIKGRCRTPKPHK